MKIHPMAVNHILIETDNGVIIDVNENTGREYSDLKLRMADNLINKQFEWVTGTENRSVKIQTKRRR